MARIEVCKTTDVAPGSTKRINFDERDPIGIYHLEDGFHAIDDICSHGGALLSMGEVENDAVICPFHGGSFDIRTGIAVGRPCIVPINTYAVTIVGDAVWIEVPNGD